MVSNEIQHARIKVIEKISMQKAVKSIKAPQDLSLLLIRANTSEEQEL